VLCPRCGGTNDETLQYCRTCGIALQAQPAPLAGSPSSRLEATAPVLGILWLALAAWSAFGLVRIYLIYHRVGVVSLGSPAFLITTIQSGIGILLKSVVAYALFTYRGWGRMFAIAAATYHLLMMAIGQISLLRYSLPHSHTLVAYANPPLAILTLLAAAAICVYTLVVFAPARSGAAWREAVARKGK
jgi:hypothetical protein